MTLAAIFGFAGLVFADSGTPANRVAEGGTPTARAATLLEAPANDTCAGAIPLTLNRSTVATNLDANDDYQTPDTAACYSGIGQQPTKAEGRDVVFSFTAPADGKFTFGFSSFSPNDPVGGTGFNPVLYLTDCANAGTVNCVRGVNRGNPHRGSFTGASNGFNQGNVEAIDCVPMTAGQTLFLVFDDRATGKCSPVDPLPPAGFRSSNCYQDSDCQTPGAVCKKVLNAGGRIMIEVRECHSEVEPNDTPATANPYNYCGMIGETHVAPAFHCKLGNRAGNVCVRSGFMPQDHPDSKMICSVSGGPCSVDTILGTSTCPGGPTDLCQGQVDPDCDPRCDVGPNAGKTCATQAFCNPVSDQSATCAGSCVADTRCVDNATGLDTGVACTPVCVGSATPGVNGRFCSALSGCPGGGVCTVTPNPPTPGATCLPGQTCSRVYNEGDTDFYSLGVVPAGSAVFAMVNPTAANDGDYRLRVTTDTQTLQFDDDDGFARDNQSAPVIAGALATGAPTYLEVSKTQFRTSATYELRAHVRPPLSAAQLEDEESPCCDGNANYFLWPGDVRSINAINNGTNNGYVRGQFGYGLDTDCFKFLVNEGDLMDWFGAANPQRTAGATTLIDHPEPMILDATPAGISQFLWNGNPAKNTTPNVPQPSLKAISPAVTSTHLQWRAQYTGMVEICFVSARQSIGLGVPSYPNNWSGSLTSNCGPVQAAGPGTTTTDVSLVTTGPAGPVTSGDIIDYTITVTNSGNEIAQEVSLAATLDANLTFINLLVDDGFGGSVRSLEGVVYPGNNVACFSLPTPGYNDPPIDCVNASIAPGTTTTYTLRVQVNNCIGDGVVIDNTATITSVSTDPNPANDTSTLSITTVAAPNNGCTDLDFSGGIPFPNLCTVNDTCQAGVCISGGAPNCDDNSLCTDDSCDPHVGCINDSSQAGDLCNDFIDCTHDYCDPILFCQASPEPPGTPCNDGNACSSNDACQSGVCVGVPIPGDADSDGVGDACDVCVDDPANDVDGDGACGNVDNCPDTANPPSNCDGNSGTPDAQCDADGDGRGDPCDNCPSIQNAGQFDDDHDGIGNACDSDPDGDGVPSAIDDDDDDDGVPDDDGDGVSDPCADLVRVDCDDNCSTERNTLQRDRDHDGVGDACDLNDGLVDGGIADAVGLPPVDRYVWIPEDGALSYNVYRALLLGQLGPGSFGTCYRQGIVTSYTPIGENPPPGNGYSYLVTAVTAGGEGSLGDVSGGVERVNSNPCP